MSQHGELSSRTVVVLVVSSRTDRYHDVDDVTSSSTLDLVEIKVVVVIVVVVVVVVVGARPSCTKQHGGYHL